MKVRTLVESALIGILGVNGWLLLNKMPPSAQARDQAAAQTNERLRYTAGRGIGVRGDHVDVDLKPGTHHVVAFLIRDESVDDDVRLWRDVARLLPDSNEMRLIGYCEGTRCTSNLASRTDVTEFPILAYGEVVGSQVVFNADREGSFVVSGRSQGVSWRSRTADPGAIVKDLLR